MSTLNTHVISNELMDKIKSIACGMFSFNKNELFFKEGDHIDYIYLIETGDVLLKKEKNNQKIIFHELMSGELLGVDCVYNDGICNYSATAKKTTKGIKIPISEFKKLISEQKKAPLELMKYLSSVVNKLEKNF